MCRCPLSHWLERHGWAALVGLNLAVSAAAAGAGWALPPVLLVQGVLTLATVAALERHWPERPAWRQPPATQPRDTLVDGASAALLLGAVDPALKAGLALLAVQAATWWPAAAHAFPAQAPVALQLLLALAWNEFARYWLHRWHHEWPALWRLHALHHAPQRVYWLNGLRVHPLNHALNTLAALGPLWALGTPPEDRKSTRLNSSHSQQSRMPSSA